MYIDWEPGALGCVSIEIQFSQYVLITTYDIQWNYQSNFMSHFDNLPFEKNVDCFRDQFH